MSEMTHFERFRAIIAPPEIWRCRAERGWEEGCRVSARVSGAMARRVMKGGTIDILTSTNGASFTELAASHPITTNLYEVPSLDGLVAAGYLQIGFDGGGE